MTTPTVSHRYVEVNGVRIFYREAGPRSAPTLLLLHGFPSASHQYRRLIDALGTYYRVIAPDYPGFGHSDAPKPASQGGSFAYTFDTLSEVLEGFCMRLGLTRFVLYAFDFGAPVGLRVAVRHPSWIAGLVVQNGNAYEEGLSPIAREMTALVPGVAGAEDRVRGLLTLEFTRSQYLTGATHPERIAPDGYILDQYFLDLPGRKEIQIDLALDYHNNIKRYPEWQGWLRRAQPATLVLWGKGDPFFIEAGARAYLRDVPRAELHFLETGHFVLEEELPAVTKLLTAFMDRVR